MAATACCIPLQLTALEGILPCMCKEMQLIIMLRLYSNAGLMPFRVGF